MILASPPFASTPSWLGLTPFVLTPNSLGLPSFHESQLSQPPLFPLWHSRGFPIFAPVMISLSVPSFP